jgi:AcrR family transcriptional regulator
MTETAASPRRPGRPRSQEANTAILSAALDLLLEHGAAQTSIEQVAQRAGVTRATVYRRFTDKTALLVQAIESLHTDHEPSALDWPDIQRMLTDWAGYLSQPRNRKMLRRLHSAADDYPELLRAYLDAHGRRRASAVRKTLAQAREDHQLPPGSDVEILQQLLNGAALHHLGAYPDTSSALEIEAYLIAMLKQAGYQSPHARTSGHQSPIAAE